MKLPRSVYCTQCTVHQLTTTPIATFLITLSFDIFHNILWHNRLKNEYKAFLESFSWFSEHRHLYTVDSLWRSVPVLLCTSSSAARLAQSLHMPHFLLLPTQPGHQQSKGVATSANFRLWAKPHPNVRGWVWVDCCLYLSTSMLLCLKLTRQTPSLGALSFHCNST
jgi:hypothetical protein